MCAATAGASPRSTGRATRSTFAFRTMAVATALQQEIIEPDVVEAAEYISSSWQQGVESIIETGRRLVETRERWKHEPGKWSRLLGRGENKAILPFLKSHAYRLIDIAEDARLVPHEGQLPSDTNTLYYLTRLSDERFAELLEDGRIHPGMKRNEASAETREEKRAQ